MEPTSNRKKFFDLSIPLRFNGEQPNAYGVEAATSMPYEAGEIIGDTRLGGSVNFEQYTFIPHCNGTHTECVGHITDERISVADCLKDIFIDALVISVTPSNQTGEMIIGENEIKTAIDSIGEVRSLKDFALVVRTLPNDASKLSRRYDGENIPPYFSPEAITLMLDLGVKHLLCDLPSIDRIFDEGKLENHRLFWNVKPGSRETDSTKRKHSTITELIYVDNEIPDGIYGLNLQIPHFVSDCAPSRPILIQKN